MDEALDSARSRPARRGHTTGARVLEAITELQANRARRDEMRAAEGGEKAPSSTPWLSCIERFPESKLGAIMSATPAKWATPDQLVSLKIAILNRPQKVRDLIESVRLSSRAPFVGRRSAPAVVLPTRLHPLQPQAA